MKYEERQAESVGILRQALPLMVEHKVIPNPLNYALWYTYVSNTIPLLNKQLDQVIHTYGTCPSPLSEELFREHVIKNEVNASAAVEGRLISLINDLHENSGTTVEQTQNYSDVLDESLDALQNKPEDVSVEAIVQTLSASTIITKQTIDTFKDQIDQAQQEIENLRSELKKAKKDAHFDQMTGLLNRRVFDSEIKRQIDENGDAPLSLIFLDVDHFKQFNDKYGHQIGDKVLQGVGTILIDFCNEPIKAFRYGGEEFVVILPSIDKEQAMKIAEAIRIKIMRIRIRQKDSNEVIKNITASLGVSQLISGETAKELVNRADKALYTAKDSSRNCVMSL